MNSSSSNMLRGNRLETRMELGDGMKPSARCVRIGENKSSNSGNTRQLPTPLDDTNSAHKTVIIQDFIVERRSYHADTANTQQQQQSVSRFASQRAEPVASTRHGVVMEGGFPSYSNFPVGTLARRKTPLNSSGSSNNAVRAAALSSTSSSIDPSAADSIIQTMSQLEITDYLQEIHSSLSSDKIVFLRARGNTKKQQQKQKQRPTNNENEQKEDSSSSSPLSLVAADDNIEFYQAVSSIQTPEELDQVFNKYQSSTIEKMKLKYILRNYGIDDSSSSSAHKTIDSDLYYHHHPDVNTTNATAITEEEQELEYATNLLRSSSHIQRFFGSKMVADLLNKQVCQTKEHKNKHWPIYLPVSLRCLLDDNSSSNKTQYIRKSYVLQSIYSLLLLFTTTPSTTTTTQKHTNSPSSTSTQVLDDDDPYPFYFMNDAVPTITTERNVYPTNLNNDSNNNSNENSTASVSSAAKTDGIDFYKDPIWTLLSKMQFIPSIMKLMQVYATKVTTKTTTSDDEKVFYQYSIKSIIAICGILSMISARSSGAACAIVDAHSNIISLLAEATLVAVMGFPDPHVAIPCLELLCTLTRQSRHIATCLYNALSTHHCLQSILAVTAESDLEWKVQKLCLILWRAFLRYGLALSSSSMLVTLGASSIKWQSACIHSLIPEYLSTFAEICHCAAIVTTASNNGDVVVDLTYEEKEAIALSGMWIAPTIQHIVALLSTDYLWRDDSNKNNNNNNKAELFKTIASMLNLLSAYLGASAPSAFLLRPVEEEEKELSTNPEGDFYYVLSVEDCLSVLHSVLNSGLWGKAADLIHIVDADATIEFDVHNNVSDQLKMEAASCNFTVAYLSLLGGLHQAMIRDKRQLNKIISNEYLNMCLQLKTIMFLSLEGKHTNEQQQQVNFDEEITESHIARVSWMNQAHFSMIMFFCTFCDESMLSTVDRDAILCVLRPLCFLLLGRLRRGDEYLAFALIRQDVIFQLTPVEQKSPLQKMLHRQLCDSEQSRAQLVHSINGRRPTESPGRFVLNSLRSEAERVELRTKSDMDEVSEDGLLPLGPLWLFHVLSSTVVVNQHNYDSSLSSQYVEESSLILTSTLEILLYVEQQYNSTTLDTRDNLSARSLFDTQIERGEKLYHLCNICFFPEGVLGGRVQELFLRLFVMYATTKEGDGQDVIRVFGKACFDHSKSSNSRRRRCKHAKYATSKNETKLLLEFATDLCTKFLEYGAQYDLFIVCIRFLMRPGFPTEVVSHIILQLQDNWHLLTTEEESANFLSARVTRIVEDGLQGGLPNSDGSCVDSPQILSAYSCVLKSYRGRVSLPDRRQLFDNCGGLFYVIAVATLVRNLSFTVDLSESYVRKRFVALSQETVAHILEVAKYLQGSEDGTKSELSRIALEVCYNSGNTE